MATFDYDVVIIGSGFGGSDQTSPLLDGDFHPCREQGPLDTVRHDVRRPAVGELRAGAGRTREHPWI
jgi:hypothetical protein